MDSDRLSLGRTYVNRARARGDEDEHIHAHLLHMGWTEQDIAELSGYLETPLASPGHAKPPPAPPPPPPEESRSEPAPSARPSPPPAPPPPRAPERVFAEAASEPPAPSEDEAPPEPARPKVSRRRSAEQLEVIIGTAWLTRIGVVAVTLAAAYLFIWAYTNEYIGDGTLVVIGLLLGAAMMVGAEFTRRAGYTVQSQALTGGGAAVLYVTIWAAQELFDIGVGIEFTFPAMAVVTVAAALQAIRHESETIATLAWISGYVVPLLIDREGVTGAAPLFGYLAVLSIGVFVVAQRFAWPTFTGLALLGAYSSGAYIYHASAHSLTWTLTYLMLITAGMLWVSTARKGREGENFGAVGTIAGYLVIGIVVFTIRGEAFVPYMYLLALSASALTLGHMQDWLSLRWMGAVGSFIGFLLLLHLVGDIGGDMLLLYVAMSVGGIMAISATGRRDAEPLALSAVGTAYAAALILFLHSQAGVGGLAMFIYLTLLAAGVVTVTALFDWRSFSRLSIPAAFLATWLLQDGVMDPLALVYVALLASAALAVAVWREDHTLGAIAVIGAWVALPLTRAMEAGAPVEVVPIYLVLATIGTLVAIEWGRWHGMEWISLIGAWGLYAIWRGTGALEAGPEHLNFTPLILLPFIASAWFRHIVRSEGVNLFTAALACLNAAAFFGFAWADLAEIENAAGGLALGLTALYATVGVVAIQRQPSAREFGPVHLGLGVIFLTGAIPLLADGYHMTMFWTAEFVLLLALALEFHAPALRTGALLVLGFPLLRGILIDSRLNPETYSVITNTHAMTMLALSSAMYLAGALYAHYRDRLRPGEENASRDMITVATIILLWIASMEAWHGVGWQLEMGRWAQQFALSGVWVIFGIAFLLIGGSYRIPGFRTSAMILFGATIGKVLVVDPPLADAPYWPLLHHRVLPLIVITAALYAVAAWYPSQARDEHRHGVEMPVILWATALLLWILSTEAWIFVERGEWELPSGGPAAAEHLALSSVWLLFGVALLIIGALRDHPVLRWSGLCLLGVTVAQVFIGNPPTVDPAYYPLINAHAAPLLALIAVAFIAARWYHRSDRLHESERGMTQPLILIATALLLWVSSAEAWCFVGSRLELLGRGESAVEAAQHFALSGVWVIFAAVLIWVGAANRDPVLRWGGLGLLAMTVLKVFTGDPSLTRESYLPIINPHAAPLLAVAAVAFVAAVWYGRKQDLHESEQDVGTALIVVGTALLLWIFSTESWRFFGWRPGVAEAAANVARYAALSTVWLAFAAVFLAIGTIRDSVAWRWAALALFGVTTIKVLALDPPLQEATYTPLLNPHAIPLIVVALALFAAAAWYVRSRPEDESTPATNLTLILAAIGLLVWVASVESQVYLLWNSPTGVDVHPPQQMALSMIWLVLGAILFSIGIGRESGALRIAGVTVLALVAGKVLIYDPDLTRATYYHVLVNYHALPLLLIAAMLLLAHGWYRHNGEDVSADERVVSGALPFAGAILLWWVLTTEACCYADWTLDRSDQGKQYALSMVRAIYGAALAAVGLWRQNPALRWMAIGLLGVTIVKVFILDLKNLENIYRVLALAVLGVVLIGVGFGYQRLVRDEKREGGGGHSIGHRDAHARR